MPRGKELEQLPIAHTLAGVNEDKRKYNREILTGEETHSSKSKDLKK
jgi:hypothetical protein